jgi:hypothetical protein
MYNGRFCALDTCIFIFCVSSALTLRMHIMWCTGTADFRYVTEEAASPPRPTPENPLSFTPLRVFVPEWTAAGGRRRGAGGFRSGPVPRKLQDHELILF